MEWNFDSALAYLPALAKGASVTLQLTVISLILGSMLGLTWAVASISTIWVVRFPVRLLIEALLGTPVLVLLIWLYYCLPVLHPGLTFSAFWVSAIAFSFSLGAFVAEIIRGGIGGVGVRQLEAGYVLGLDRWTVIRRILLPQAIQKIWPPLIVQYITLYKLSTLAAFITVPEILHTGSVIIGRTFRPLEVYTIIAIFFVLTVTPLNRLARRYERFERVGGTVRL